MDCPLDTLEGHKDKRVTVNHMKTLIFIYALVMGLLAGYVTKKHWSHCKKIALTAGVVFYKLMRDSTLKPQLE